MAEINVQKRTDRSRGLSQDRAEKRAGSTEVDPASDGPEQQGKGRVSSRCSRNVSESLSLLSPAALRMLRESYTLLDSDGTGEISRQALKEMLLSLGCNADAKHIDTMIERTGEPLTFPAYLGVMSELVHDLPPRMETESLLEAFEKTDRTIDISDLREALLEQGQNRADVDSFLEKFVRRTRNGMVFNTQEFLDVMSI